MMLLWACIAWVFAATIVAMLPMRQQYFPGIALLIAAPLLILWVGISVAWWAGLLALAAFVSMFRNPLRYLWAKARGQNPQLPPELRS
ncbi:DUF2484 family protein [uncultured Tateyamaria sp.]|uniref:DUF2484 family protein n=1 Tax=uncultured Tateyamaria sp. TaxID=455651 RepID=UPI00261B01E3|nr:DUF2484 family protein [uncultured Tateyamaria sp.]